MDVPRKSAVAALLFLAAVSVTAQISPFGSPSAPAPRISLEVRLDPVGSGDRLTGRAIATIEDGWHVNSHTPSDEFLIPTVLSIDSPLLRDLRITYPPHEMRTFGFAEDELAVYEGRVNIPFTATRTGGGSVEAKLRYQACNDTICLPPTTALARFNIPAPSVAGPDAGLPESTPASVETQPAAAELPDSSPVVPATPPLDPETFTPLSSAPSAPPGLFGSDVSATLASRGLLLTLVSVFVLGLALNLTPCVYPLIPITIAFFSSQSEGSRSRRVLLSVSYVLGIAATYSALGVFSALTGRLFGAWLQLPSVLIFFAVLMLVLAASMFGAFDIRVPHFISDRAGARSGVVGALVMGLLVGIVAAPCVGPFVISLIALVGQSGSVPLGFTLFFVLALGLGVPYLFLGIFSSGLDSIPRSGIWMDHIKRAMGFVLIGMAFYFVWPQTGDTVFRLGVGLSLLVGAVFLFIKGRRAQAGRAVAIVCGIVLLAASAWFLYPRPVAEGVEWTPYDETLLVQARESGSPVIIDFYADWCLPCKELDARTFTDPAVIAESERFVRLKADLTQAEDPQTVRLTSEYQIIGVPTIAFIDGSGTEILPIRLTGFENSEKFLRRMQQVR